MADVSLARKKELEEQDPFLENVNKVLDLAKKYKILIISILIAIVVVWLSVSYYLYYMETKEANGLNALQLVTSSLTKANEAKKPISFDLSKKGYEGVISEFGGTVAEKMAMFQLGDLCFNNKKYDQAIDLYKKAQIGFTGTSLENLILESLAISYEQKKDLKNAELTFQKIITNTNSSYKKNDAYYHLGILYGKQNKTKESNEMFGKIDPKSIYYKFVEEKL